MAKHVAIALRRGNAQVTVGRQGGDAPARRALQVTLLDQVGLDHVLDGARLLADAGRDVVQADRPAVEAVDHGLQQLAVHQVEALRIDVEHGQRLVRQRLGDAAVALDLRIVAHPPQQPVWKLGPRFELFAEVANVFNRRCSCRPLARRRAIPFCSSSLHALSPRNAPRRAIIAGMSPARFTQRAFCVLAATGLGACSILPLPRVQPRTEPAPATSVAPKSASPAPAPAATPQAMFERPAAGPVLASFDGQSTKGIDISGGMGEPVFAAAAGQVIYVGSELPGYGNMIIIKHDDTFLTAYGHNGAMLVKEKDKVRRGQKIAEMGSSAADGIKLRFEVRRNGAPVDPVPYLEGKRHD